MQQTSPQQNPWIKFFAAGPLRIALAFIVPVLAILALRWSIIFMQDDDANRWLVGAVALIVGVGGVWALYLLTDNLVSLLPTDLRERVRPLVFVGPATLILFVYLVYPTINTLYLSFRNARGDAWANLESPFGLPLDNYIFAFTNPDMLIAMRNNLLWLIFVTSFVVGLGLVIAVMVDRIRMESLVKSIIFLPMAISAVGAAVIWRFIYAFQPASRAQIGILNAIWVSLGGEPQGWLLIRPWNNFFLIIIMIWLLTGFAMVVISAAVKGVPSELLEAARIDGATEVRIFFSVIIPFIRGTLLTITTTVLIMVLKVFDIVFVMTSGQNDTEVIANRMYREMFTFRHFGRGSALAVILLLATVPIMISNIRNLNEGEK